ncbi:MAG: homoserine dehydrogenase [Planctomycetota bacterium]|nr:homoserine dehydrogenase [Planctomycetota bacterium]
MAEVSPLAVRALPVRGHRDRFGASGISLSAGRRDTYMKTVNVGIIGFGTVGSGAAAILAESDPPLSEKTGIDIRLKRIAEKDRSRWRPVGGSLDIFTERAEDITDDPEIEIAVEVIGGIEPARSLILRALDRGKAVVTANKALLATHGRELFRRAMERGSSIGFEASVAGGVPVIGAMRDGLIANRIEAIVAILNGTSNYVLTRMVEGGIPFPKALAEAQAQGYAERNPANDIEGTDTAHKLVLLAGLAFHSLVDLKDVSTEGISNLAIEDIRYAGEMGYGVKLLAVARRRPAGLELRVHPALVPKGHPLYSVRDVFNGVLVVGDATGPILFCGRGAGRMPTGSAVVADIVDAARGTASQAFSKIAFLRNGPESAPRVISLSEIETRYFVRFTVQDRPGVLGAIAGVLGGKGVSIASVIQKEPVEEGGVPIVMMTHSAKEKHFRAALEEIGRFPFCVRPPAFLRVEE